MSMEYTSEGRKVVATHQPSGDRWVAAEAATPADAERAAAIIMRGMKLNRDRHYTASARMYARLDDVAGYRELAGAVA
jgi:hypothetical protein